MDFGSVSDVPQAGVNRLETVADAATAQGNSCAVSGRVITVWSRGGDFLAAGARRSLDVLIIVVSKVDCLYQLLRLQVHLYEMSHPGAAPTSPIGKASSSFANFIDVVDLSHITKDIQYVFQRKWRKPLSKNYFFAPVVGLSSCALTAAGIAYWARSLFQKVETVSDLLGHEGLGRLGALKVAHCFKSGAIFLFSFNILDQVQRMRRGKDPLNCGLSIVNSSLEILHQAAGLAGAHPMVAAALGFVAASFSLVREIQSELSPAN
ncbi:MAG: hypothetical protein K0S07_1309 [Chlamydiales bacterium]|jgi:hypothetical protein|nr:hypothetical protein [Chlamydiales bacterium]